MSNEHINAPETGCTPEEQAAWHAGIETGREIERNNAAASAEPVAWAAVHFGGRRDGKIYTTCDTREQIEAYIQDVHQSSDSLTLRARPLAFADAQAQPAICGYTCTVPDDCETLHWRGQILSMNELASVAQPAAGEEIHVHIEGQDVLTLPLASSGMDAPRFVVHVPAQQPVSGADKLFRHKTPEGDVVVSWSPGRERIVAVTRQDEDHNILSVIAEAPPPKRLTEVDPAQWRDNLHTSLNAAAGEGLVMDGVDAADLYCAVFPDEFADALASPHISKAQPSGSGSDGLPVGYIVDGQQTYLFVRGLNRPRFSHINGHDPVVCVTPVFSAQVSGQDREGWKEAAIAWEVCASLHRDYAQGRDPLFKTRQSDFVKHAEDSRLKVLSQPIAKDKVDAERYRWLRDSHGLHDLPYEDHGLGPEFPSGAALDAAIDHARRIEGDGE